MLQGSGAMPGQKNGELGFVPVFQPLGSGEQGVLQTVMAYHCHYSSLHPVLNQLSQAPEDTLLFAGVPVVMFA